jgi:hypothetical protein
MKSTLFSVTLTTVSSIYTHMMTAPLTDERLEIALNFELNQSRTLAGKLDHDIRDLGIILDAANEYNGTAAADQVSFADFLKTVEDADIPIMASDNEEEIPKSLVMSSDSFSNMFSSGHIHHAQPTTSGSDKVSHLLSKLKAIADKSDSNNNNNRMPLETRI